MSHARAWLLDGAEQATDCLHARTRPLPPPLLDGSVHPAKPGSWLAVAHASDVDPRSPTIWYQGHAPLPAIGRGQSPAVGTYTLYLLPHRPRTRRRLRIRLSPEASFTLDCRDWPGQRQATGEFQGATMRSLRDATRLLQWVGHALRRTADLDHRWAWVLDTLTSRPPDSDLDPLERLLQHQARSLERILADLARRPREVLRTVHERLPLHRIRQIDTKSLRWEARQPGRTREERAGPRQRLLAPRRRPTARTYENRVVLAFTLLTIQRIADLAVRYRRTGQAFRDRTLDLHKVRCHRLAEVLVSAGVQPHHGRVSANFVLRNDERYNRIWRAYEALRRNADAEDIEWMWQDVTFRELALVFAAAVAARSGPVLAQSPIQLRSRGPLRGSLLARPDPPDPAVPVLTAHASDLRTVSVHEMPPTGASCDLRTEGRRHGVVLDVPSASTDGALPPWQPGKHYRWHRRLARKLADLAGVPRKPLDPRPGTSPLVAGAPTFAALDSIHGTAFLAESVDSAASAPAVGWPAGDRVLVSPFRTPGSPWLAFDTGRSDPCVDSLDVRDWIRTGRRPSMLSSVTEPLHVLFGGARHMALCIPDGEAEEGALRTSLHDVLGDARPPVRLIPRSIAAAAALVLECPPSSPFHLLVLGADPAWTVATVLVRPRTVKHPLTFERVGPVCINGDDLAALVRHRLDRTPPEHGPATLVRLAPYGQFPARVHCDALGGIRVNRSCTGVDTARGAVLLLRALQDNAVRVLDRVGALEVECLSSHSAGADGDLTARDWYVILPQNTAVPADTWWVSQRDRSRVVLLDPGARTVLLKLRRSSPRANLDPDPPAPVERAVRLRASGAGDRHRTRIEPRVHIRALGADFLVRFTRHPYGAAPTPWSAEPPYHRGVSWSDVDQPVDTSLVPALFEYGASEAAWAELEPILDVISTHDPSSRDPRLFAAYDQADKAFSRLWKSRTYPVSSAGEPPPAPCDGGQDLSERDQAAIREEHRRLLCVRDAAARMRARLERHLDIELARPGTRRANLLFTAPTWLFTAGDEAIPLRIARALAKRDSPEFLRLGLDNPYSEWGACSGVGRGLYSAAAIEEAWNLLRTSPPSRPIFRAAAFGHPLARQPAATRVLCADPLLRDWILAEVHEGLAFLVRKRNRSFSKPGSVSLYARYLFLAVRALLRMKDDCPDPFQTISPAQSQIVELLTQIEATHHQRAWLQTPWAQEFELPLLQRTVRLCRGEEAPVDIPGAP